MLHEQIETWLRWLAYGLPVVGILWGFWAKVARKPVRAFMDGVASISDLGGMREDIRYIKSELTHNGGKSVKDMVRRIEIEGRHREAMMRAHFANNNEGQFQTDVDGKLTWANETLTRWTGMPEHNLHGKSFYSIIATDEQEGFRYDFENAIAERREFRGRYLIRSLGRPSESDGNRVKHLATDWRVAAVRDATDPKIVIGYSGNLRLRPQPSLPADDGA